MAILLRRVGGDCTGCRIPVHACQFAIILSSQNLMFITHGDSPSLMMVTVRAETDGDLAAIRAVHRAAFPSPLESKLVDALRGAGKDVISLVAEEDARVLGHVLFSAVSVDGARRRGLGLAPVAVMPSHQGRGVGSTLIRAGLAHAATLGADFVVVLGEPTYYRRFGFQTASLFGLSNEYGVDEPFMALALKATGLKGVAGLVRYQPEFMLVT